MAPWGLDNQGTGRRYHLIWACLFWLISFTDNPLSFTVTGCLCNVIAYFFEKQTQGTYLESQGGCGSDLASPAPLVYLRYLGCKSVCSHLHTWVLRPKDELPWPQAYSGRAKTPPIVRPQKVRVYLDLTGVKHEKKPWRLMSDALGSEQPKKVSKSPLSQKTKLFF